ncbi:MAG: hypothetical protein ABSH12_00440 [Endomicrobiales bacterium]|jgi:tetratricopeptide (TPR) repeat protein
MKKIILLSIVVVALAINATAKISDRIAFDAGELSALETSFFADLDDGLLEQYTLYDAYLIASGLTDQTGESVYRAKFDALRRRARIALSQVGTDPYIRAKALLFWLHENVFRQYRSQAIEADGLLDNGSFNCLSSSIVYALFARELGLCVKGVLVKDHSFCMLEDPRGDKDIETTIRFGFDPGVKEIEQFETMTSYVYVAKKDYQQRRTVEILPLIGAIYSNKAGQNESSASEWKANLTLYKKGYYFDPDSNLYSTNIIASLNNGAIDEMEHDSPEKALNLILQGRKFSPEDASFSQLEEQYYDKRAQKYGEEGDYETAVTWEKKGLNELLDSTLLRHNLLFFYTSWAAQNVKNKNFDKAIEILRTALTEAPQDKLIRNNLKTVMYNRAVNEYNTGNYQHASQLVEDGLELFPRDSDLTHLRQSIFMAANK